MYGPRDFRQMPEEVNTAAITFEDYPRMSLLDFGDLMKDLHDGLTVAELYKLYRHFKPRD